jgi:hypothetical protein
MTYPYRQINAFINQINDVIDQLQVNAHLLVVLHECRQCGCYVQLSELHRRGNAKLAARLALCLPYGLLRVLNVGENSAATMKVISSFRSQRHTPCCALQKACAEMGFEGSQCSDDGRLGSAKRGRCCSQAATINDRDKGAHSGELIHWG